MTLAQMVERLVANRHTLGSRYTMRARMRLAVEMDVSEGTIRNWLAGKTEPLPTQAAAIRRFYQREVADNG